MTLEPAGKKLIKLATTWWRSFLSVHNKDGVAVGLYASNSQDGIIGPFDRYDDGDWVQLAKNQFQQVI